MYKDPFDAQNIPFQLKLKDDSKFTFEIQSTMMVEKKEKRKEEIKEERRKRDNGEKKEEKKDVKKEEKGSSKGEKGIQV